MDIQEIEKCYCFKKENIQKLDSLGLLQDVPVINGKREFDDQSIRELSEMIDLMNLGLNDNELIAYYRYKEGRINILRKLRISMLENLHISQKKLDDIDYIIYQHTKEEKQS